MESNQCGVAQTGGLTSGCLKGVCNNAAGLKVKRKPEKTGFGKGYYGNRFFFIQKPQKRTLIAKADRRFGKEGKKKVSGAERTDMIKKKKPEQGRRNTMRR